MNYCCDTVKRIFMLETSYFLIMSLKKEGKLKLNIINLILVENVAYVLCKEGFFKIGSIIAKML